MRPVHRLLARFVLPCALPLPFFLAGGCANVGRVNIADTQAVTQSGDATIQFSQITRPGLVVSDREIFVVSAIEGPSGVIRKPEIQQRNFYILKPGRNTLTVNSVATERDFSGHTTQIAATRITFFAASGVSYLLNGISDTREATFWITERDTMKKVTNEIKVPMSDPVRTPSEPPPVFIPVPVK